MKNKIIRSICYFSETPSDDLVKTVNEIADIFKANEFLVQTKRICSPNKEKITELDQKFGNDYTFSKGSLIKEEITNQFDSLFSNINVHFNLDLTNEKINLSYVQILFDLIKKRASKTFNFTYVFNNLHSAPFFPSATYQKNGFSIGLQPTDLSLDCNSVDEWLDKTKVVWDEIIKLFNERPDFLGIDSSVAPLVTSEGSFIGFIKRLGLDFSHTTTTDLYIKITKFIKTENPKPIGLCGLMLPCLEDTELANEYEKGNFSIERNLYLSLHSGLGIDTYPIGVNEDPERVLEILKLTQGLSNKYKKPLSVRFVSDGMAKIDERTDFKNEYLKDVKINKL